MRSNAHGRLVLIAISDTEGHMKKQQLIIGMAAFVLTIPAYAQTSQSQNEPLPIFAGQKPRLDSKEVYGAKLANQWKTNPDKPRRGEDGNVKYLFGATLPTLVCTPLQVCSIRLQQGEIVNDVHAGDAVRWKITPATEGSGQTASTIIIIKPTDINLTTNLIVTTDRRTYTIKLASTKNDWMPILSFDYPDDIQREWAAYHLRKTQVVQTNTMPATGQNLAALDFNYNLSGDNPSWKPVRIYTDGIKTYIQFPSTHFNESPALLSLGNSGDEELVNYRLIGDRYVVDKVLDRAALIVGVGLSQTKVEIIRKEGSK